ncbi:hypothetical protein TGRH88_015590 [Toxoplasma gondii]|uniref:Uncharacterized protein n=1 Tax=Toxoplasma gondii TaxID=5811 RepID=A0A7J6KAV4_TOXGO|nr:hypothetical protein TGRH88_015590 [Toxoplasma gondii]
MRRRMCVGSGLPVESQRREEQQRRERGEKGSEGREKNAKKAQRQREPREKLASAERNRESTAGCPGVKTRTCAKRFAGDPRRIRTAPHVQSPGNEQDSTTWQLDPHGGARCTEHGVHQNLTQLRFIRSASPILQRLTQEKQRVRKSDTVPSRSRQGGRQVRFRAVELQRCRRQVTDSSRHCPHDHLQRER